MKRISYFLAVAIVLLVTCEAPPEWHDKVDNVVPGNVSNLVAQPTNGGAILTFTFPNEEHLLGARATFTLTNGEERSNYTSIPAFNGSSRQGTITLDGFGDTEQYTVTVQTMHLSGNYSSGETVSFRPEKPEIFLIRESMEYYATFGGIDLRWENPQWKHVRLSLYWWDAQTGLWVFYDNYYSSEPEGRAVFRGFEAVETQFKVEISDSFQNYAQPLDVSITPLLEVQIVSNRAGTTGGPPENYVWSIFGNRDGAQWRGDIYHTADARRLEQALDARAPHNDANLMWSPGHDGVNFNLTNQGGYVGGLAPEVAALFPSTRVTFPLYITLDMGRKAIYTRMNIQSRTRNSSSIMDFSAVLPVHFTVWGSNEPKPLEEIGDKLENLKYWTHWPFIDGRDEWKTDGTWTEIGECFIYLSDGSQSWPQATPLTPEDHERYTVTGYDFEFDHIHAYRYLRWEIHRTNTGNNGLMITGLRYWGQYVDD